jgi:hypothetical protein
MDKICYCEISHAETIIDVLKQLNRNFIIYKAILRRIYNQERNDYSFLLYRKFLQERR